MSVTPVVPPPEPAEGGPQEPAKSNAVVWIIVACALGGCCVFAAIIAAIAIPNLIDARKGSNEAASIGALRTLTTAQALYREGDKDKNGTLDYAASLEDLRRVGLIDGVLGGGTKQGYRFEIVEGTEERWSATAVPLQPGKSGDRSFFADESGIIRSRAAPDGAPATVHDRALGG